MIAVEARIGTLHHRRRYTLSPATQSPGDSSLPRLGSAGKTLQAAAAQK